MKKDNSVPEEVKAQIRKRAHDMGFRDLSDVDDDYILKSYHAFDGHATRAAIAIGMSRSAFYRHLNRIKREREARGGK